MRRRDIRHPGVDKPVYGITVHRDNAIMVVSQFPELAMVPFLCYPEKMVPVVCVCYPWCFALSLALLMLLLSHINHPLQECTRTLKVLIRSEAVVSSLRTGRTSRFQMTALALSFGRPQETKWPMFVFCENINRVRVRNSILRYEKSKTNFRGCQTHRPYRGRLSRSRR